MMMHMKRSRYITHQYQKIKRSTNQKKGNKYHKLNQSMDISANRAYLAAPALINE